MQGRHALSNPYNLGVRQTTLKRRKQKMAKTTRTIATIDAGRIQAALRDAAIRYAIQIDGDVATLIMFADEGRAAADVIAAELAR